MATYQSGLQIGMAHILGIQGRISPLKRSPRCDGEAVGDGIVIMRAAPAESHRHQQQAMPLSASGVVPHYVHSREVFDWRSNL